MVLSSIPPPFIIWLTHNSKPLDVCTISKPKHSPLAVMKKEYNIFCFLVRSEEDLSLVRAVAAGASGEEKEKEKEKTKAASFPITCEGRSDRRLIDWAAVCVCVCVMRGGGGRGHTP